jgi:hypothetical protein
MIGALNFWWPGWQSPLTKLVVDLNMGKGEAVNDDPTVANVFTGFETTTCEGCDNVHAETRKMHPGKWLCIKFKRVPGGSFIAPHTWVEREPYMRCNGINGGLCPMFVPRREKSNERKT